MKWSQAIADQVIAALQAKHAPRPCDNCGVNSWTMADGLFLLVAQKDAPNIELTGAGMPSAALICTNCGNTRLINLVQIGLGHLFTTAEW